MKIKKDKEISEIIKYWGHIAAYIYYPKNDSQYKKLVKQLDKLLDVTGQNENHPIVGLIDITSHFIEEYESEKYRVEQIMPDGIDALKFLMETHHLNQADLTEIGSQGIVSEILSGKRQLNLRQIKLLSKRFGVSPATFIDDGAILQKSTKIS